MSARTRAMGAQRRGERTRDAQARHIDPRIRFACRVGFGESPDSQKLSRPLQADRAALLSDPCRLPARGFLSLPIAISGVRIDCTAPRYARLAPGAPPHSVIFWSSIRFMLLSHGLLQFL